MLRIGREFSEVVGNSSEVCLNVDVPNVEQSIQAGKSSSDVRWNVGTPYLLGKFHILMGIRL